MYSLVVSAVSAVMGFSVLVAPVQAREGRTTAVQLASGHLTTGAGRGSRFDERGASNSTSLL